MFKPLSETVETLKRERKKKKKKKQLSFKVRYELQRKSPRNGRITALKNSRKFPENIRTGVFRFNFS